MLQQELEVLKANHAKILERIGILTVQKLKHEGAIELLELLIKKSKAEEPTK